MFQLYADKNKLTVRQREPVTSGSVNVYEVQFAFSGSWDGLARTAVFRCGGESRSVLLDETGGCVIPWEVLQKPLLPLEAGVYGTRNGDTVLPTVWAGLGTVLTGAAPGDGAQPPTPDIYQQIVDRLAAVSEQASAAVITETCGPASVVSLETARDGSALQPVTWIVPRQEGSGTPSLENIRSIAGWDALTLTQSGKGESCSFAAQLPETVYSGTYDWTKGELTVTHVILTRAVADMNNSEDFPGWAGVPEVFDCFEAGATYALNGQCLNIGTAVGVNTRTSGTIYLSVQTYGLRQSEWKERYPDLTVQMVFPLLEPRVIQLQPEDIRAIPGMDTLSSSAGDTLVTVQADLKRYVDKAIRQAVGKR